jgi:thiol-disulfide isomerase/thioredoxin
MNWMKFSKIRNYRMPALVALSIFFIGTPVLAIAGQSPAPSPPDGTRPYKLMVGDPAPALGVSNWVKGDKLSRLEKGRVYVVEFWATWCGPCMESIPHLTELQRRHGDKLQIVGISVWENEPEKVPAFVEKLGAKMDYAVAQDLVPPFPKDVKSKPRFALENGRSSLDWLIASGWDENGIPVAFIIDRGGRIAWISEPLGGALDSPLEKVISGTWDTQAYAVEYAKRAAIDKRVRAMTREMNDAYNTKNYEAALEKAEQLMAFDPAQGHLAGFKFEVLLVNKGNRDSAYAYARKQLEANSFYQALSQMAWVIVFGDGRNQSEDLELAQALAERANTLSGGTRPGLFNTLARIAFLRGDGARAVELQTKAVELAASDEAKQEYSKTLEEYKKARRSPRSLSAAVMGTRT